LPRVTRPQPLGPQVPRPWGIRVALAGFPWLSTPAYRLEAGGRQRGIHVLTGHQCGEAVARDIGFGQLEHPASDLC
jgi:hypothetical protein